MNKLTAYAVTLLASAVMLSPTITTAADKTPARTQPVSITAPTPLTPQEIDAQITYLDNLTATLKDCRALNNINLSKLEEKVRLVRSMGGTGATAIQRFKDSPEYRRCESEAKADFQATARDFIGRFREPKMQDKAKEALAQWMTAIDAVSNDNFAQEASKFATLANGMRLELSLD